MTMHLIALRGLCGTYGRVPRKGRFTVDRRLGMALIGKGLAKIDEAKPQAQPVIPVASSVSGAPAWFPDWRGETIVLVASGPSAVDAPLDLAMGRAKVIAINNSWELVPFADILYGCDAMWWSKYGGVPGFKGLKLSQDEAAVKAYPDVHRVKMNKNDDRLELKKPGTVGWGGNSGFHAFNLAVQMAPKKIILVGYDLHIAKGLHWHGKHVKGLNNPTTNNVKRWLRVLEEAVPIAERLGIRVINASPISALKAADVLDFDEALEC